MRELLQEIAALNPLVEARFDGNDGASLRSRSPAGADMGLRFAAIPMGHEFTSLVLALLQAAGIRPSSGGGDRADPLARRRLRLRDLPG